MKKYEKLKKQLLHNKESAWLAVKDHKEVFGFAEEYKEFLNMAKTERESVKRIEETLKNNGFTDIKEAKKLSKGSKVFKNIHNRAILCAIIGKEDELRIAGSHIDSPRLDLKPYPLYEDSGVALFRSHYYGGIKKYQWMNTPLAMHAVVHTKKGKKEFSIGDNPGDPQFIIPDLLPHLARDQMDKKAREFISGEDLHIVVGNIPVNDEKDRVKLAVLKILNERYDIVEKDLISADISFVPAQRAIDIGLDSSMVSAYGQDDHVCAYTCLRAVCESKPKNTAIVIFADKEEIGSVGNTGAQSRMFEHFISDILHLQGSKKRISDVFENSSAISCDVTAAMNPLFKESYEASNANILGNGVSIEKYGGHGGKYTTHEASSEYMSWIVDLMDKDNIKWQTGEVGKIDLGGGGTIAMFISKYGMEIIDMGPPVLAMHSTAELTSKVDIYEAYKAYKAFLAS